MSAVEEAIRLAVEKGGYDRIGLFSDGKFYFFQRGEPQQEPRNLGELFLDPLFWKACSKAKGWNFHCEDCGAEALGPDSYHCLNCKRLVHLEYGWFYEWHRFIDHLAEGEDAESFFANL